MDRRTALAVALLCLVLASAGAQVPAGVPTTRPAASSPTISAAAPTSTPGLFFEKYYLLTHTKHSGRDFAQNHMRDIFGTQFNTAITVMSPRMGSMSLIPSLKNSSMLRR
ncbi:hypothetical protein COCNU_06G017390 [Cocos nucifera]|uniref:Dirigent protein n=1 Tax=Cocos nucifera TaxID=13894 RepID=A0A8K0ID90_COCNU|nr:hypothetical protein COCNU_06G017390 [Cocos nucifera]